MNATVLNENHYISCYVLMNLNHNHDQLEIKTTKTL